MLEHLSWSGARMGSTNNTRKKKKMMVAPATPAGATWHLSFESSIRMTTLVISATSIITVVVLVAIFVALKRPNADRRPDAFCCPTEARAMIQAVNRTLDPCDSFYTYVCTNTIKYRLWPSWDAKADFMRSIATATNLHNNSAAVFLSSVFKKCVETTWRKRRLAAELAEAIADLTNLKSVMTYMEMLLYLLQTNLKFVISSAISIRRSSSKAATLKVSLTIIHRSSALYKNYKIALDAAANAFNIRFGTNVSIREVYHFERVLNTMIEQGFQDDNTETSPKLSYWMNIEVWKHTVLGDGWRSLDKFSELDIEQPRAIEAVIDAMEEKEHHQAALVFFLAHSTLYALATFISPRTGNLPHARVFHMCFKLLDVFPNLKDHMYTGILTSADKERHMHDLYALVVRAVELDIKSRKSLKEGDVARILDRLHRVSFVAPSERLLNVTIPRSTLSFARDFLEGRLFEFNVNELRERNPDIGYIDLDTPLSLTGERYMMVSPAFFKFLSFNSTHKAYLNMAAIGVQMSARLWDLLLNGMAHLKEMETKINDFYECFRHKYFTGRVLHIQEVQGVSRALALDTVLSALNRSEWYTLKTAWSVLKMSPSQLFYIREMFHLCPLRTNRFSEVNLNVPLSYNQDFVSSFNCTSNSRMSRVGECAF